MYRELRIAVVIPAFNERHKIAGTVATVPDFADPIIVIDDASLDDTSRQAELAALGRGEPARVEVIRWRGDRDEREWPKAMTRGGTLPWTNDAFEPEKDPHRPAEWTPHSALRSA